LEKDKIIFTEQYGFRKNLGTEDALINTLITIYMARGTQKKISFHSWTWKKHFI